MNNAEINAEIAFKVMGWTMGKRSDGVAVFWPPDTSRGEWKYGISIPKYSTDISYAFEVVEKMRDEPESWECLMVSQILKWNVTFETSIHMYQSGWEESLPRAICLAALKAVGK